MTHTLEIHPLGGLGEFGMNMMLFRYGDDSLIVDAGLMFPDEPWFGIDRRVPDPAVLDDIGTLHGIVLTHGHEDHIGALPWLIGRQEIDLYGTAYTLALVRRRLSEHPGLSPRAVYTFPQDGGVIDAGPFRIEPIRAAHSIPETRMLIIEIGGYRLLHTADFKLDTELPVEHRADVERLRQLGDEGVDILLADSTNADVEGTTPGERAAHRGLADAVQNFPGAVIVSTFSSHMQRLQGLGDIARSCGRKLALLGSSLTSQVDIAVQHGLVRFPAGIRIAPDELRGLPRNRTLVVAAGSQGEPRSSLAQLAAGRHRWFSVAPGDRVLHSARTIPGNEPVVGKMLDLFRRAGAEVLTGAAHPIHVSGHPSADELSDLIRWVRPRWLIPVHGEFRQLSALQRLALDAGVEDRRILVLENGDRARFADDRADVLRGDAPPTWTLDEQGDPIPYPILQDRRWMANSGVVFVSIRLQGPKRLPTTPPRIVCRGFSPAVALNGEGLILGAKQVIVDALHGAPLSLRRDPESLEEAIQQSLRRYFRRQTRRQPLIVPVVEPDDETLDGTT